MSGVNPFMEVHGCFKELQSAYSFSEVGRPPRAEPATAATPWTRDPGVRGAGWGGPPQLGEVGRDVPALGGAAVRAADAARDEDACTTRATSSAQFRRRGALPTCLTFARRVEFAPRTPQGVAHFTVEGHLVASGPMPAWCASSIVAETVVAPFSFEATTEARSRLETFRQDSLGIMGQQILR